MKKHKKKDIVFEKELRKRISQMEYTSKDMENIQKELMSCVLSGEMTKDPGKTISKAFLSPMIYKIEEGDEDA